MFANKTEKVRCSQTKPKNANLTCRTSREKKGEAEVRKQPEDVNKCPSVPWGKSVY